MIETDVLEFIEGESISNKEVFDTYYNLIEDLKTINKIHIENIPRFNKRNNIRKL